MAACRRRVVFASAQGATAPAALRVADCRSAAMLIKSALRDLPFCVIGLEKHYINQPPPVAFPPFGASRHHLPPRGIGRATKGKRLYGQARRLTSPDLHILCRMCTVDNKAPRSNPFISSTTISTGCSAPACGGSPAKRARGKPLDERSEVGLFSNAPKAVVKVLL